MNTSVQEREAIERRLNSISPRGVGMKGQAGPSGLSSGHLSAGDLAHIQVPTPRTFATITVRQRELVLRKLMHLGAELEDTRHHYNRDHWLVDADRMERAARRLITYVAGPVPRSEAITYAAQMIEESWREYASEVGK